jgi:hypothetical protein
VTARELLAIERALRERELVWAQKRVVSEQVARAREAVLREVKSWGLSGGGDPDAMVGQILASAAAPSGKVYTKESVDKVDPLDVV